MSILQPTQNELAGASMLLLEQPVHMNVQIEAAIDNLAFSYTGEIHANGDVWQEGTAKAASTGIIFEQECRSIITANTNYHHYKTGWVPIQRNSPMPELQGWIEDISMGRGTYRKEPITASSLFSETMKIPEYIPEKLYLIQIPSVSFDFTAWCNSYLDSLFLPSPMTFTEAKLGLYFDTETRELSVLTFQSEATNGLLRAVISMHECAEEHSTDFSTEDIYSQEVSEEMLSEQWEIANSTTDDLPNVTLPDAEILKSMETSFRETQELMVYLNGMELTLPCTLKDVLNAGFKAESSLASIPAQTDTTIRLSSQDGSLTVVANNASSNAVSLEDVRVSGVYLMREDIGAVKAALPGGITLASATEDVSSMWTEISGDAGLYQVGENCTAEVYELYGDIYCIGVSLQD